MKVQIISVALDSEIPKKDGGTYRGTLIVFKDLNKNMIGNKGISATYLDKNSELKNKIAALTPGQDIELVFTKQGSFNNLTDVVELKEEAQPAKQNKSFMKTDPSVQRSIVRQSAVAQIVNLFVATGTVQVVDEELINDVIQKAELIAKYTGEGL